MFGHEIDEEIIDHYSKLVAYQGIEERTASRLKEMAAIGMVDYGASFGVPNVMDGMYIERVWQMDDDQFKDYLDWVKDLIERKAPAIAKAKEDVFSFLIAEMGKGADIFSGRYEHRFDRLLIKVTRTTYDNFCIYYSTGNIGFPGYSFYITENDLKS